MQYHGGNHERKLTEGHGTLWNSVEEPSRFTLVIGFYGECLERQKCNMIPPSSKSKMRLEGQQIQL